MNEQEIAAAADDFKAQVRAAFSFLEREYGFEPAADESGRYSHRLVYRSRERNQEVTIANAFHPVDYGFEVVLDSITSPRGVEDRDIVYFQTKEKQQTGFAFLAEAAQSLRVRLRSEGTR